MKEKALKSINPYRFRRVLFRKLRDLFSLGKAKNASEDANHGGGGGGPPGNLTGPGAGFGRRQNSRPAGGLDAPSAAAINGRSPSSAALLFEANSKRRLQLQQQQRTQQRRRNTDFLLSTATNSSSSPHVTTVTEDDEEDGRECLV